MKIKFLSLILYEVMAMNLKHAYSSIVTVECDQWNCLGEVTAEVRLNKAGLEKANAILNRLRETLLPLMPAAGLAAPQIGIKERIFIFSWDREFEHLQAVINPSYVPLNQTVEASWEACFSTILCKDSCQIAKVPRYTKIHAQFYDEKGNPRIMILEKFAARVFQHEYDHLEGIVNIFKPEVEVKKFENQNDMNAFLAPIKASIDASNYIEPREAEE